MPKFSEWVVAAWAHSSEAFGAIAEIERPNTPPTRRRNAYGRCNLDTAERGIDIAADLP